VGVITGIVRLSCVEEGVDGRADTGVSQGGWTEMRKFVPWVDENGNTQYLMGSFFLQDYRELSGFCDFLDDKNISSYFELGVWRGQMLNFMKRRLGLSRCYGADIYPPSQERESPYPNMKNIVQTEVEPVMDGIELFIGNSHTWEYVEWRQSIGEVDLVFIDACHEPGDVFQDLMVEYAMGLARFVAMHDIAKWSGPHMAWERICDEMKLFSVDVGTELGIGVLKGPREGGCVRLKNRSEWK